MLIILGLTRRIADTPPEEGARLDVVGTATVRARPRPHRVRHPPLRYVGIRPAQGRCAHVAGAVAGDLADARRRGRAAVLPVVGESPSRPRRCRAARSGDAAEPDPPRRAHVVLPPVLPASRPLLRRAVVPVGGARAVGDRDRRPAAAAVHHPAAGRRGRSQGLPERLTAPRCPGRVPRAVRRHRGHGGRARRGRRARDRDLADAARGPRYRRAGLATRERDRVVGARRAER